MAEITLLKSIIHALDTVPTSYCRLKYTIAKITHRASSYCLYRKYIRDPLAIPSISHFPVLSIVGEA